MVERIIDSAIYGVILLIIIEILRENSVKLNKYKDIFFEGYVYRLRVIIKAFICIADFVLTVSIVISLNSLELELPYIIYKLCYAFLIAQLALFFLSIFCKRKENIGKEDSI